MLFDLNTQVNNYKIINDFIEIIKKDIDNYDKLFAINKGDRKQGDKKQDNIKQDNIKQDNIKQDNIKQDDIKQDDKKQDDRKQDELLDLISDRKRIDLKFNNCDNNYLLIIEDKELLFSYPPIEKFLYDISPSYKYIKTSDGNNKNKCVCYATLTIPTTLNNGPIKINNSYYSDNELNNFKKSFLDIKCNNLLNLTDMLLYTGIINDDWYIPINNLYSNKVVVKENIYNNNIIISEYCIQLFQNNRKNISFFTPNLYYENNKIKIDIQYSEKNQKDMDYLIYTTYLGKKYADDKYNLSYTDNKSNNNYLIKDDGEYNNIKCIYNNNVVLLDTIVKRGNVDNFLNDTCKSVKLMMIKRANKLTEVLNNFRIGNIIGYELLHLICSYTLCYLIIDKVELLKINDLYTFNKFDEEIEPIKKYKDVFNKRLQKKLQVRLTGGNKNNKNKNNNKFAYYKNNMDNEYIAFVNEFYSIINRNSIIIKNILNKNIQ